MAWIEGVYGRDGKPSDVGKWSDVMQIPLIPAAGYVVPDKAGSDRVLLFSAYQTNKFGGGGVTQFADYNPMTGAVSQRAVANTNHDMFCPGISTLQSGKVLITSGADAAILSLYDLVSNLQTRLSDIKIARGY